MEPDAPAPGRSSLPSDPLRGRLLDSRYRIGARIARGGMASVYEALDVRLDRTVAVKIMHAGLSDDDGTRDFAERFVREARSAARLSHPNIVAVYDQGDDDGIVFLVMELIAGHTLRDTITKEAPMSPSRALALLEPVISALASAHRSGLIHRDVKPENVLIADDGRVKVADFGLAKAISADTQHTATQGVLIGTVSYLAPELVIDGSADARADVYAIGVVLYELLTGVKPHEGETPIQVAYRHVHHDVPPPSERVPTLPAYVDALVARATARDRSQRPADAGVLLHQLHRVGHALAAGVREDPELTQDLTPYRQSGIQPGIQSGNRSSESDTSPEVWDDAALDAVVDRRVREHTTVLPTFPAPAPRTDHRQPALVVPAPTPQQPRRDKPPKAGKAGKAPKARRSKRGPILLVLALILAVAIGGGAYWYGEGRYTHAPSVLGETDADAVSRLQATGLEVAHAEPIYSSDVPEGAVVAADPGGGARLLPGDTVTLTLSLGKLLVPMTRGLDEATARAALMTKQLVVGKISKRFSETQEPGTVLASSPKEGAELSAGDTVSLIVSKGKRPIPVGSWVGKDVADARARIEKRGLVANVVSEEYSTEVPEGAVIRQDPPSGTLNRGEAISLTVSKGPEMATVPSVRAFGVDAATQKLQDLGFVVDVEKNSEYLGIGFAVRTDPPSGSVVPKGSTIILYVI